MQVRDQDPSPDTGGGAEEALRSGYLQYLPRLAKANLLVLRAASVTLGWDFSEHDWTLFARAHDLPVASTFARSAGGGSFAFAKFLAAVGPLPPHPGGPRIRGRRQLRVGWDAERLLLGAMTVARMNGSWPSEERFDDAAQKARARGVEVPLIAVIYRKLGLTYTELKLEAGTLAKSIESEHGARHASPPTYDDADEIAHRLALGIELLGGERPYSDVWDVVTRPFRKQGVPVLTKIMRTFDSWQAAWAHVKRLGLDAGVQADERPRYVSSVAIARSMARAEDKLGYRPTPNRWTDDVRELRKKLGPGFIPAKPTIYYYFPSWKAAWAFVDALRARGTL